MALRERIQAAWGALRGAPAPAPEVQTRRYYGGGGNLLGGGLVNYGSGMGTGLSKAEGSFFTPTRIWWRTPLEILGVESWVARNALDIPNDDMFIKWRDWVDDDEGKVKAMREAEKLTSTKNALNEALKAADQYGSGVVVMATQEAPLEEPLQINRIREGDLKALHYFDRFDLSVTNREPDFFSDNYGKPTHYQVHPTIGGAPLVVHHSRVIRFDAIRPPTKSGFTVYDQDFGVSVLIPIIISILQDQTLASGISHMSQEASIPILHISGLRELLAGAGDPDEPGPEEIGQQINMAKSIYRLMMLDGPDREDLKRVGIVFGGLADLMDKFQGRVAAARKIPMTRFTGSPPVGLNATGESDMKNYVMMMEANRENRFHDHLDNRLDMVLARNAGMKEPPEYEWRSLLQLSDTEIAEAFEKKVLGLKAAAESYFIDEDEGREALNGDPVVGDLHGPPPEPPEEPDMDANPMNMPKLKAKVPASNGNGR